LEGEGGREGESEVGREGRRFLKLSGEEGGREGGRVVGFHIQRDFFPDEGGREGGREGGKDGTHNHFPLKQASRHSSSRAGRVVEAIGGRGGCMGIDREKVQLFVGKQQGREGGREGGRGGGRVAWVMGCLEIDGEGGRDGAGKGGMA